MSIKNLRMGILLNDNEKHLDHYTVIEVDLSNEDSIRKIIQVWMDEIKEIKEKCKSGEGFYFVYVDKNNKPYEYISGSNDAAYDSIFGVPESQHAFWMAALEYPGLKIIYTQFIKTLFSEIVDTYETMASEDGMPFGLLPAYLFALKYPDCIPLFESFIENEEWNQGQLNGNYQCTDDIDVMMENLNLE